MIQRKCALIVFLSALWLFPWTAPSCAADGKSPTNPSRKVLSSASELDYPPFALVREDGAADGFSVDLLKAVCRAVGLEVSFRVGPWHAIKNDLANGELDVLPLVAYTDERHDVFDFTTPYLIMHSAIFVRKGETSIQDEADLMGKEVLVMRDDMAHEYAVRKKVTDRLILTDSFEEAMKRLSVGKHDAVIVQHLMGLQLIKKLGITNVVSLRSLLDESLKPATKTHSGFEQKICIAVHEGDKELLALLNEGLALVIAEGVYDELYDKWFGPILPRPAVSPATIGKYLAYILLPLLALIGIATTWFLRREVDRKTGIIKENEEKFAVVFKKSPFPVMLSRFKDGIFIDVNESWTEAVGIDREDAIGRTTEELDLIRNPEERARIYALLKNHGSIQRMELTGYRTKTNPSPVALADMELIEIGGETCVFACVQDITDKKRADEALKRSEEHLKRAQKIAHLGSWELDLENNQLTWSDEVYRIFGFQPQQFEATYEVFLESVHPDDRQKVDAAYSESLRDNLDNYEVEHRVVRPDGEVRYVHERCEHLREGSGRIVLSMGMVQDVTDRVKSEAALQKSERRLSMAISATADAIWEWNLLTSRTYYSPRWYEMLGYENNEIPMDFDGWKSLCHSDDLQPAMDLIQSKLESVDDPGYAVEFRMRTKDESWVWILSRGRVVERDAVGKPVLLSGTNTDITERKRAEEAVRQSQATLQSFYDSAPLMMGMVELQGEEAIAVHGNKLVAGLFNAAPEQLPGRNISEINPSREINQIWLDAYFQCQADNAPVRFEYQQPRTAGFAWISATVAPVPPGESGHPRYSFVAEDITTRKRAEEELKASLTEKEVLLKEIHHRVKNNMQVISSLVNLQADEVKDPGMRAIFQDIIYRVRSMAMVHEKLYQSTDLAHVDFAEYAQSLLGYLWRAQEGANKGIQLDLKLEPVLLPVTAAVPCGLILNELFGNALKHAFKGRDSGKVTVSLHINDHGEAQLGVKDNGTGMPQDFDWRKASSLGLRLVQMLGKQLHAAVEVESDRGTTFTILLKRSIPQ